MFSAVRISLPCSWSTQKTMVLAKRSPLFFRNERAGDRDAADVTRRAELRAQDRTTHLDRANLAERAAGRGETGVAQVSLGNASAR